MKKFIFVQCIILKGYIQVLDVYFKHTYFLKETEQGSWWPKIVKVTSAE